MRALVVEDSRSMRRLLATLLEEQGLTVFTAETGEEALAVHAKEPCALMVVDWTLPGLSGLDVCRQVRAMPDGEDVVLLVVTGRNRPEDLVQVLDSGASDYLAKPIDPDVLRTRLTVAVRRATEARHRRREVNARQKTEEAFRLLVESAPDAVVVLQDGVCVFANKRFSEWLGLPNPDASIGNHLHELFHPENRDDIKEMLSGESQKELSVRCANGKVLSGECVSVRVQFNGVDSQLAFIRDTTERKQMQSQLLLADRMVSVGTLAAGVAHELNNPLAYVLNNLALTNEELEEGDVNAKIPLLQKQIAEAIDGAKRMSAIVRDLRTFSRGDDERSVVSVSSVLDSSLNICLNEIRHIASLTKEIGNVPDVLVNESRLGQVFLNLLINAAQAMGEGDLTKNQIVVSARTTSDGWAEIQVVDNGMGISPDVVPRIFDPFYTTKMATGGTGLGLSICHNIVMRAGGRLSVESIVGEGTTFTIALPPALRAVKHISEPPKRASVGTGARVLVVDDETLVGRSIRRALRGHEVSVVNSGAAAIDFLCASSDDPLDIVLCDLMMPEVSGMDVYEQISALRPDIAERFVFMTGGAFTRRAREFLENIDKPYLEKPFNLIDLRALVLRATRSAPQAG